MCNAMSSLHFTARIIKTARRLQTVRFFVRILDGKRSSGLLRCDFCTSVLCVPTFYYWLCYSCIAHRKVTAVQYPAALYLYLRRHDLWELGCASVLTSELTRMR